MLDLEHVRSCLTVGGGDAQRRKAAQRYIAEHATPADLAAIEGELRRLPADETTAVRDLLYR